MALPTPRTRTASIKAEPEKVAPVGPDGTPLNSQQLAAQQVLFRISSLVADGYPIYRPSFADVQFLTACIYGISTRHQLSPAQMKCLEILEKKAAAKIQVSTDQRVATEANNLIDASTPTLPPPAPVCEAPRPPSVAATRKVTAYTARVPDDDEDFDDDSLPDVGV